MRICFASFYYPDDYGTPEAYLDRFYLYLHLPAQLARRGHDILFVQLHPHTAEFRLDGVRYAFVPPESLFPARLAARLTGREASTFALSRTAVDKVVGWRPDVVHFHGTQLHLQLAFLRRRLGRTPLVLHYHGGEPTRWSAPIQRRNLRGAASILFTTPEQRLTFSGMLPARTDLVVETSSPFEWEDRLSARRKTGMTGDPVCISAARLHPVKDPWTTLRGFEMLLETHPAARLYHFYRSDELLAELQSYVRSRPDLARAVEFRGELPYERMSDVYNSADFLLQSSLREFSGCAVLDAMACGVIPVVTDIPSFRAITDGGRFGLLFERERPDQLAGCIAEFPLEDLSAVSDGVLRHFKENLSFEATATRLEGIYIEVCR